MNIRPHTMNDLDRYGPLSKLPAISAYAWEGRDLTEADLAALQAHFREKLAPLIARAAAEDPARYLEILASLRPHLFDAPKPQGN